MSKNQQKRHVGQESYQVFYKVMCSIAIQIQRNSAWSFLCFFFSINEELRSVVNEHFNGKLFSQILDTECVTFINCNKCNFNIRSLNLILIRNSMKRQTEKRGRQAFRDAKNIQNSTCCPGKAKCLEYNSA